MKIYRLDEMTRGWFVGNFSPTCLPLTTCEVGCKYYRAGDKEEKHIHKEVTEITLIVSGLVKMNDNEYKNGDIILLLPGEPCDFFAIEDTITVIVKSPSISSDKFFI